MNPTIEDSPSAVPRLADFDCGAERLLEVIGSSCDPDVAFVEQLETTLAACLELLGSDRDLAYLLTVAHLGQLDLAPYHQRWVQTYARLLRQAAERSFEPPLSPPFAETYLIAGISWKIRGRVAGGIRQSLPRMRTDLMQFLLPYYLGIEEADRIVGPGGLRSLGYFKNPTPRAHPRGHSPASPASGRSRPALPSAPSG